MLRFAECAMQHTSTSVSANYRREREIGYNIELSAGQGSAG
jgi:hypothetical protein